jgi:Undecaprenyl-phosphate glucose phosphotransferase
MSSLQQERVIAPALTTFEEREASSAALGERTARLKTKALRGSVSPSLLAAIEAIGMPLCMAFAALLAKLVYFDLMLGSEGFSWHLGAGLLAGLLFCLIAGQSNLHSPAAMVSGALQLRAIAATVSVTFLLLLCIFYLLKISDAFSRAWLTIWYILSLGMLVLVRAAVMARARSLRAECRLNQRVAVYGRADLAKRVAEELLAGDRNLVLAGIFTGDAPGQPGEAAFAGGMQALIGCAQAGACDRIVLALPAGAPGEIRDAIASVDILPIEVQLCPDAMTLPWQADGACGRRLLLVDIQRAPFNAQGVLIKTAMDYAIGAIFLVLFAPAMAVIAMAIKLDSRGPVFFIQSRHGYNHRIIRVFKFRTMTVCEDGAAIVQAVRGDRRVTRIGRFLRRTSLDELPQLCNVLRGELSLVGPRPHALSHNETYSQLLSRYASRHKVKPGITGWAQVNGFRGETKTPDEMRRRVEMDLDYIARWSPWLDLEILARTALVPFSGTNAF